MAEYLTRVCYNALDNSKFLLGYCEVCEALYNQLGMSRKPNIIVALITNPVQLILET